MFKGNKEGHMKTRTILKMEIIETTHEYGAVNYNIEASYENEDMPLLSAIMGELRSVFLTYTSPITIHRKRPDVEA